MAAEMWYYTTEGKQMDPVTIRELRRLVEDGYLKPTDMVWKDGMARWIRASSVKELFPDPGSELDQFFSSPAMPKDGKKNTANQQNTAVALPAGQATEPEPAQKKGRRSADDDEDDSRPQRRKRRAPSDDDDGSSGRRNEPKSGGNSGIILIALILGGGLVLFAGVVGVLILILARGGGEAVGTTVDNPVPVQFVNKIATYVEEIPPLGQFRRTIKLKRGATYEFTVKSDQRQPDVDLLILNSNGLVEASDVTFGPDSRIDNWTARDDGDFKIEVRNLDKFTPVKSTVTIRETAPPPAEKKQPFTEPPLPKDVLTGQGTLSVKSLKPGEDDTFKFRVKAGHNVKIDVTPFVPKAKKLLETDFNLFVLRDSDGVQLEADTLPNANAVVTFRAQATEIIRVRVVNAGKSTPTRSKLYYDVSP